MNDASKCVLGVQKNDDKAECRIFMQVFRQDGLTEEQEF